MDEFTRRELSRQISGLHHALEGGDELFLSTLQRLRTFRAAHGRAPEAAAVTIEESRLGRWVEAQRTEAHGGTLSGQRRALLYEALGDGWALETIERGVKARGGVQSRGAPSLVNRSAGPSREPRARS